MSTLPVPSPSSSPDFGDPSEADVVVVGVGASAGGLEALGTLFQAMPPDCGVAFVVIQHLSPDHPSYLVELLSRRTPLSVVRADEGMPVEAGQIHLIPPGSNLEIQGGRLHLVPPEARRGANLPIDVFFRSLARDRGERAVGVVLSGTGSDGTLGIRAIREAGGLVVVQSEDSAQFAGMPRSAIATGLADLVVAPAEMPEQLLRLVRLPREARREVLHQEGSDEAALRKVFVRLRDETGVDFSFYKPSTIDRRLARRISANQLESLAAYEQYLQESPPEVDLLFNELLIGVTRFFRDPPAWEALAREALPRLLDDPSGPGDAPLRPLRLWAAACSTGEEAWSLAILLAEAMAQRNIQRPVRIFATDISRQAIQVAHRGIYTESEVAGVSPERLDRWFLPESEGYRLRSTIRDLAVFAQHDLTRDPPFSRIDLVACRNTLIYFGSPLQNRVLDMFHHALVPGGLLFLGTSEGLGDHEDRFRALSQEHRIFQSEAVERPGERPVERPAERTLAHRTQALHRLEQVYREVISDYVPACIVVDEQHQVVHLFGRASDYLHFREGRASNDLLRLAGHGLAPALRTALHQVEQDGGEFTVPNVRIGPRTESPTEPRTVRVRVREMADAPGDEGTLRLVFIEEDDPRTAPYEPTATPESSTDLDNLLATSSVGTLLLDEHLRIRRVSRSLEALVPVTPRNESLPIDVLAGYLNTPGLPSLAQSAAFEETLREVESRQPDGRVFLLRLAPYRTDTGSVKGLVLTVIDITTHRQSQERERRQAELFRGVLDAIPAHVAVVDRSGTIRHVNRRWKELEVATPPEAPEGGHAERPTPRLEIGTNYFEACEKGAAGPLGEAGPTCLAGFREVLSGRRDHFSMDHPGPEPEEGRWLHLAATPLPHGGGLVISHSDITERRRSDHALVGILEVLQDPSALVWTMDPEGRILSWSPSASQALGWTEPELMGEPWTRLLPPPDPDGPAGPDAATPPESGAGPPPDPAAPPYPHSPPEAGIHRHLALALEGKGSGPAITCLQARDGSIHPFTAWFAPLPDQGGALSVLLPSAT